VHATAAPDGAGADRVIAVSSARSATSADSAATGSADRRMVRQVEASSIQVGISRCRATSAPTRLHRAQAPASRSSTWWTWTKCPAHGCQAYATTTSAAVPVLWVLCRRVLQPATLALRPGLPHPGRGAGQHGRGSPCLPPHDALISPLRTSGGSPLPCVTTVSGRVEDAKGRTRPPGEPFISWCTSLWKSGSRRPPRADRATAAPAIRAQSCGRADASTSGLPIAVSPPRKPLESRRPRHSKPA
jgi:hypothetical protein